MHFLFYYSRVLYGMTPGEIPSHPLLIDLKALSPFYKVPLSARVAFMMVFLYQQTLWLWPLLPLVQFNPPYGHLVITATIFSGRPGKRPVHFLVKKKKKKKPRQYGQFFFGPLVTVLTGFHCTPMVSLFSPPRRSFVRGQGASKISPGSMVLSTGFAHRQSCTGFSSTARVIDPFMANCANGVLHKGYHLIISFSMAHIPTACFYSPLQSRPLTSCFSPAHLLRMCCPGCSPSRLFAQPLFHL